MPQLGVGTLYSFLIWLVGYNFLPCCGFAPPTKQSLPKMAPADFIKMLPVAFCSAAAHSSSVLALNAGSLTFGQIVKAGEPVFSALVRCLRGLAVPLRDGSTRRYGLRFVGGHPHVQQSPLCR